MRWLPDRIRSCLAIVIEDTPNLLSRTANRRWCLPMAVRGSQFLGWPQVGWAPGPETRCPTVAAPDAPRCVACVRPPGTRANHPGAAETFQWRQPVRCRCRPLEAPCPAGAGRGAGSAAPGRERFTSIGAGPSPGRWGASGAPVARGSRRGVVPGNRREAQVRAMAERRVRCANRHFYVAGERRCAR